MRFAKRARWGVLAIALTTSLVAISCSSGGGSSSAPTTAPGKAAGGSLGANPGDQPAGDASKAAYTPTGTLVADNGFRPETDGFGFQNYGTSPGVERANLSAVEVRKTFGDAVCADAASGKCDLIPPAQSWMDQINQAVGGGHCYGFSVAALMYWKDAALKAGVGGGATPALTLDGNVPLQRDLAYTWAYQTLPSVRSAVVGGTPNEVLDKLIADLKPGTAETYTIAIFKADKTGGHAVTPYAVEDAGNGIFNVLIYDNNYPKVTRALKVDRNANTWSYDAATNPSEPSELYLGTADSKSLSLYPTTPGPGTQPCPFCGKVPAGGSGSAAARAGAARSGAVQAGFSSSAVAAPAAAAAMDEIYLDASSDVSHGHLLITDAAGHRLGYVDGKLVNEIPNATTDLSISSQNWRDNIEPTYYVPDGVKYTITLDGTGLTQPDDSSVGVIGPTFDLAVDGVHLDPGQKDTMVIAPDATELSYTTTGSETPKFSLGVSDTAADYEFNVSGLASQPGGTIKMGLPVEAGKFTFSTSGTTAPGTYALNMSRFDEQGVQKFGHDHLDLAAGDSAALDFGNWKDGEGIPLIIDHNGTPQTQTLTDQVN